MERSRRPLLAPAAWKGHCCQRTPFTSQGTRRVHVTKFYCALMTGTDEPPPPPPVHTAPTPHPHAPHRPELIHHPPSQEAGSGLTPASFAPDGDLRLDTASCEFDAEVAVQLEGALQAGEVVEQGQAAQARAQAGMEGEGSQSLYRAFTRSQPGAALDHLDHLGAALAGGARRALVTCSPVPSCDNSPRCVRAQPLAPALARARARARARPLPLPLPLPLQTRSCSGRRSSGPCCL